jgi:hypothetical protein
MSNSISNLKERHRSLKYFAEKLQQPEFQAKITGIKQQ